MNITIRLLLISLLLPFLVTVSSCSLNKERDVVPQHDRWEKMNRKIFRFNKKVDNAIVKPVAKGYKKVTPDIVEKGVSNFFSNLGDIKNAVNNLLQFKIGEAGHDLTRFAFNTTFGIAGIFDVASALDMEKHDEDFGQTLAVWGVKPGPYTVLPFLGPSTLRDAAAKPVDSTLNPANYHDNSTAFTIVNGVKVRADLLAAEKVLEGVTVDEYSLIRDAWLQNREYKIKDGKVDVTEKDDLAAELDALDD